MCRRNYDVLWDCNDIYRLCWEIMETRHGIKVGHSHATVPEAIGKTPLYGKDSPVCRDLKEWQKGGQTKTNNLCVHNVERIGSVSTEDDPQVDVLKQRPSEVSSQASSSAMSTPAIVINEFLFP